MGRGLGSALVAVGCVALGLLAGCQSESGLLSVLGGDGPDGGAHGGAVRPDGLPAHPGHGHDSPWAHLDPGNLPDVYFAVAYSTYPYGYNGCYACDADAEWWYPYGDVRYAVIDLKGQVVWDVPAFATDSAYEHLDLAPGGPGQVLVTARPWYARYDAEADGWYASTNWEAYRLDAAALTTQRVAHFDLDRWVTHLDVADVDVDLGPADANLHLGMFPTDPARALFLGTDSWDCLASAHGVRDLAAVHLADPLAEPVTYGADTFLPDPDGHAYGWAFEASVDEDGAPVALIGTTPWDCTSTSGVPELTFWSPDDGIRWSTGLAPGALTTSASLDPRDGGGALTFAYDPTDGRPLWRVTDADGTRQGQLGDDLSQIRPGPLLEHASATFVDVGTRWDDGYDRIEIRSDGRVVWRIDDLRFGVGHEDVSIVDIALVPL